jgi:hypothetical protein
MLAKYARVLVGLGLVFLIVAAAQQINHRFFQLACSLSSILWRLREGPLRR